MDAEKATEQKSPTGRRSSEPAGNGADTEVPVETVSFREMRWLLCVLAGVLIVIGAVVAAALLAM